jgi:hypothetical protein
MSQSVCLIYLLILICLLGDIAKKKKLKIFLIEQNIYPIHQDHEMSDTFITVIYQAMSLTVLKSITVIYHTMSLIVLYLSFCLLSCENFF